jgi:phosphate transport system substrate-binding protein
VGIGAPKNSGVAVKVKQVNGRIGYMEYAYAKQAGLKIARVQNGDGNNYVTASTSSVQAAASATLSAELAAHPDLRFDPVACASGFNSYPITAYSHALLFTHEPTSQDHGEAIISFFYWGLTTGQNYLAGLGYASLPSSVAAKSIAQLHKVMWGGSAIWP